MKALDVGDKGMSIMLGPRLRVTATEETFIVEHRSLSL